MWVQFFSTAFLDQTKYGIFFYFFTILPWYISKSFTWSSRGDASALISTLVSLSQRSRVRILSILNRKYSDVHHFLVPLLQTITPRNGHVSYIKSNHPYCQHFKKVERNIRWELLFPQNKYFVKHKLA